MTKNWICGAVLAGAVALGLVNVGNAASVSVVPVNNGATSDAFLDLAGTVTNDIMIDGTGTTILSQQMRLVLNSGSVINHGGGGNTPPNSAFFPAFAALPYDSFVASGGPSSPTSTTPTILGRSDALGGPGGAIADFSPQLWDVLWGPALGQDTLNVSAYLAARLTLSNDANGTIQFLSFFGDDSDDRPEGVVLNGVISFGEPNVEPVVSDLAVEYFSVHPETIVSETLGLVDDDPTGGTWSLDSFASPNGIAAAVDPMTGLFTWKGNGSPEGVYNAVLSFTDAGGLSDTGTLSITWHIPEPSSLVLFGLTLVGFAGFRRK